VPFVNEDEVITLKSVNGDRPVAHLVLELVDVYDLHGVTGEEAAPLLDE
jgi:hypothetical protein